MICMAKSESLFDVEFGEVKIRRVSGNSMRLRVNETREIVASLPRFVNVRQISRFIDQSREQLRKAVAKMPVKADKISEKERKELKKQAEFWLKRRLFVLAQQHGLKYERVRIMNAKTRWGSCSSTGTISLNYALMKVPETLRDYVILHELTHTVHMHHSTVFWAKLAELYPKYKYARKILKGYSPYI